MSMAKVVATPIEQVQSTTSASSQWACDLSFNKTLATFLAIEENAANIQSCGRYRDYYDSTWAALENGCPAEADSMASIGPEHIRFIVRTISQVVAQSPACLRYEVRSVLSREAIFVSHTEESMHRTIDLTLRLWLTINVRDDEYCPTARSVQWDDETPLEDLVAAQFPKPRLHKELYEKMFDYMLPDNFTMVKLRKWSAISVDWTYDLSEHLDFDKDARILKVFPLKGYVNGLRRSKVTIFQDGVIDEYNKTINLLFPSWDIKTQKLLRKSGQTFGLEGPTTHPGPVYLSDLYFWRDRIATLYTEFCSPPPSMTQLYTDRRDAMRWYSFWLFGVLIVGLTVVFGVISSVTACLSSRYTYQSLMLAREAASSTLSCSCIVPSPSSGR